jgi:hypothetical protein
MKIKLLTLLICMGIQSESSTEQLLQQNEGYEQEAEQAHYNPTIEEPTQEDEEMTEDQEKANALTEANEEAQTEIIDNYLDHSE